MTENKTVCLPKEACAGDNRGPFRRRFCDSRSIHVNVPQCCAFLPIRRIGGDTGWYYANWLWKVRGLMDLMIGGIGLRRGRRDPEQIVVGDTIDCWRVQEYEPDHRLLLALEMRYPGRGWLEFQVTANGSGCVVSQTATYDTGGFWGCVYWYLTYPFHESLFSGMLREIRAAGVACAASQGKAAGDSRPNG